MAPQNLVHVQDAYCTCLENLLGIKNYYRHRAPSAPSTSPSAASPSDPQTLRRPQTSNLNPDTQTPRPQTLPRPQTPRPQTPDPDPDPQTPRPPDPDPDPEDPIQKRGPACTPTCGERPNAIGSASRQRPVNNAASLPLSAACRRRWATLAQPPAAPPPLSCWCCSSMFRYTLVNVSPAAAPGWKSSPR